MSGFPLLSFEQANPVLSGFGAVQKLMQQQINNRYLPEHLRLQNQLLGAHAKKENAMANLPFGGAHLAGVAGQIAGLETIKQMYGEESPQYNSAKQLFDLGMQNTQSRISYQNALTGSMPNRYLTPTGKSLVEEFNVGSGNSPTGNGWGNKPSAPTVLPLNAKQISALQGALSQGGDENVEEADPNIPGQPGELADEYKLLRQKNTTDQDTRKRNLFASNIEKSLNNLDPSALTQYSGIPGHGKLLLDKLMAGFGNPSKNYQDYANSSMAADTAAKQIRQFLGESIQPAMSEKLEQLTNPSAWFYSPDQAKNLVGTTRKLLENEMGTYRDALRSTDIYQGKGISQQNNPQTNSSSKNNQNYSNEDLEHTAKLRGISVEEVKRKLGIK